MITRTEYITATGQLGMTYGFPDVSSMNLYAREGYALIEGAWDTAIHYVTNDQITERPTQATALSGFTLTGLPVPSTLAIDSTAYTVTDSTVTLDIPLPGTYSLRVEAFPYLDWTGSVTV